jgi:hypothetical protein
LGVLSKSTVGERQGVRLELPGCSVVRLLSDGRPNLSQQSGLLPQIGRASNVDSIGGDGFGLYTLGRRLNRGLKDGFDGSLRNGTNGRRRGSGWRLGDRRRFLLHDRGR